MKIILIHSIAMVIVIVLAAITGYGLSLPSTSERRVTSDIEALQKDIAQLKKEIELLSSRHGESGEINHK